MTLDELKQLFEKHVLTEADKALICELSKENHLNFEPRSTACQNCYKDQIIMIMAEVKRKNTPKSTSGWAVVEPHGTDGLIINGELVNNSTINAAQAKRVIAAGFGKFVYENKPQK